MPASDPAVPPDTSGFTRPLPDVLALALLLAVLAPAGVTFARLPLWRGFTSPWPAFLAGALCCGLAAMQRRAGWWVLLAALLGAAATVLTLHVQMPGPTLALRDDQVRARLLLWLAQARAGQPVYDNLAVDAWSTAAAWAVGMWIAWAALRAGWHWLVLAGAGALLAVSIWYLPQRPAAAMAVFLFAALLLLARQNHLALVADARWRGVATPSRSLRRWSAQSVTVAGGAATLVVAAWLAPAVHWRAPVVLHAPQPNVTLGGVSISTTEERTTLHDFGAVLPFSGAVSLGSGLVATVEAPGPGYLFGVSYDRYESSGWRTSATGRPALQTPVQVDAVRGLPGSERVNSRLAGASTYPDSQPLDETVHLNQPSSVLLSAGPPLGVAAAAVGGSRALQFAPQAVKGAPDGEYSALVASGSVPSGGSYTTTGLISTADAAALRGAAAVYPDWIDAAYLQVPSTVPDRVHALAAKLTAGRPAAFDKALAIERYLHSLTYDEQITAPPAGEDGVDYLLFVAQRGYCDYFASAMAVMLRSVGVPARIVAGYVVHEGGPSGLFQVREHDAHAWTEAFFPGFGWERFDPTPGGAASSIAPGQRDTVAAGLSAVPTAAAAAPTEALPTVPAAAQSVPISASVKHAGSGSPLSSRAIWPALILMLALACLHAAWRRWQSPRRAAFAAWRAASLAGRLAERRHNPHETPLEYAASLAASNQRAGGLRDVAAAYTWARFGPHQGQKSFPRLWRRLGSGVGGLILNRFAARLSRLATRPRGRR